MGVGCICEYPAVTEAIYWHHNQSIDISLVDEDCNSSITIFDLLIFSPVFILCGCCCCALCSMFFWKPGCRWCSSPKTTDRIPSAEVKVANGGEGMDERVMRVLLPDPISCNDQGASIVHVTSPEGQQLIATVPAEVHPGEPFLCHYH